MRKQRSTFDRRHDREDESEELIGPEERFDKAFFIAIGIFAIFFPVIFVPIIGLIVTVTIAPYLAGFQSGKYINKKDGLLIAFIAGIIWSLCEILILFSLLSSLDLAVGPVGLFTQLDWMIFIILMSMNILFCAIGSYYAPRKVNIEND